MINYFKLMRVHHYIKNVLIFTALVCSGRLFVIEKLTNCLIGFISFCAASSIVYIYNDIKDCELDRLHPIKYKRPIASGKIIYKNAYILIVVLLVIVIVTNILIFNPTGVSLIIAYLILNFAYSFGLKKIPIIDLIILVSGFLIRLLYGAVITDIIISRWLYLTIISISFFFALGKRKNELISIPTKETRTVLKFYNKNFLNRAMYVFLCLANTFYSLWAIEKADIVQNNIFVCTIPIVILISVLYCKCIEKEFDGDPVEVLYHNKRILIVCVIYAVVMVALIYSC